jgi:hypothetical protein
MRFVEPEVIRTGGQADQWHPALGWGLRFATIPGTRAECGTTAFRGRRRVVFVPFAAPIR